jgi:hypothetical protein
MADNDLALGRVMQTLSHSRWWPEMLVIIVEDDPQGGRDHIDAHRSVSCSPAGCPARYVSPTLASFGSIMRLIFLVLGVPPLNQFDAVASLPLDVFARARDATRRRETRRPTAVRSEHRVEAVRPEIQLEGTGRITGDGRPRRHAPSAARPAPALTSWKGVAPWRASLTNCRADANHGRTSRSDSCQRSAMARAAGTTQIFT